MFYIYIHIYIEYAYGEKKLKRYYCLNRTGKNEFKKKIILIFIRVFLFIRVYIKLFETYL